MTHARLSPSGPNILIDPGDIIYPPPGGGLLRVPVGGGSAEQMRGTGNGQLTYWDQNTGLWLPTTTSPTNTDIPVWSSSLNRWLFTPLPSLGSLRYFDNTFSPVGLWNFNNTILDANGVVANDLTLGAGNQAFSDIVPGKVGLYVLNGSRYQTAAIAPAMRLQGDMSFFAIVQSDSVPTGDQCVAAYTAPTDLEVANFQWSLTFLAQTSPPSTAKRLSYLSEHGAGINDQVDSTGLASLPPVHNIAMVGFTRISNVVQFYFNGLPLGPAGAPISAPTGGTDPTMRLIVGSNAVAATVVASFVLFSMQVIASGLSAAQVKSLYNGSMGPAFGMLP